MKKSIIFAVPFGEMLEWLKRHAWKACVLQKGIKGSNPFLSANPMKEADHPVGFLRIRAVRKASFPSSPGSQKRRGAMRPRLPSSLDLHRPAAGGQGCRSAATKSRRESYLSECRLGYKNMPEHRSAQASSHRFARAPAASSKGSPRAKPEEIPPLVARNLRSVPRGNPAAGAPQPFTVVHRLDHYAHFTPENVDSGPKSGPLCTFTLSKCSRWSNQWTTCYVLPPKL